MIQFKNFHSGVCPIGWILHRAGMDISIVMYENHRSGEYELAQSKPNGAHSQGKFSN